MVAALKLEGTGGDLEEMTTADENYLAYQAGLRLKSIGDVFPWCLRTTVGTGGVSVGSLVDTFYNEAIGAHGTLTQGTTTTTLYQDQRTGVTEGSDALWHRPLVWDATLDGVQEATDTQLNDIVDRIAATMFTNDYPGAYRLSSTAPSSDWSANISNILEKIHCNISVK